MPEIKHKKGLAQARPFSLIKRELHFNVKQHN